MAVYCSNTVFSTGNNPDSHLKQNFRSACAGSGPKNQKLEILVFFPLAINKRTGNKTGIGIIANEEVHNVFDGRFEEIRRRCVFFEPFSKIA
jgi:hypothetical protein